MFQKTLPPPSQTPLANSCQEEKFSIHPCGVAMATPSHLIPLGTLCKSPFAPQQAVKVPLPLQRQLVKFWGSPCKVMLQMKHWLLARNFKDGALWETWGAGRGKQDVRVFLNRLTVGRNSLILPSPPSSQPKSTSFSSFKSVRGASFPQTKMAGVVAFHRP